MDIMIKLSSNSTYSICCGFVVQQAVRQIHNISRCCTTNRKPPASPQQIHNKSNKWSVSFSIQREAYDVGFYRWGGLSFTRLKHWHKPSAMLINAVITCSVDTTRHDTNWASSIALHHGTVMA